MFQRCLESGRILRLRCQVPRILNQDNNHKQKFCLQTQRLYSSYFLTRRHGNKNGGPSLGVILNSHKMGLKNSNKLYPTSTEPEANENAPTASASPASSGPGSATAAAQQPSGPQTTTQEIKTKKGILSVTTTVEDSKLNEIVFEKEITKPSTGNKMEATKTAVKAVAEAMASVVAKVAPEDTALNMRQTTKKRVKLDHNRSSLERNFVTPARAMSDFLLKPSDLDSLPKIKRRSPYEQEPPITVYWRKDVESKAIEVWGSKENLLRECLKREIERKKYQQNVFTVKRRLRDYRREIGSRTVCLDAEPGLTGETGRVVLIAIGINATNFIVKTCAWLATGSHCMFAEAVHSLADTINQCILAFGVHKSTQIADTDHPYGYANMKYVSSLISGVGIFCVGAGLSFYHGITGLIQPEPMQDFFWAFLTLGGSLLSESVTLVFAFNEIRRSACKTGMTFTEYVLRGKDPCVNVVLTEDLAAVSGIFVAGSCLTLASYFGSHIPDAVGSLLVGGILGAVASFIIYTNAAALVGRSIAQDHLNKMNSVLEADVMIRAIHDVKGIDIGNSLVRYKAEIDFDGRELARFYLDKQDLGELLKAVKSFQTVEELEQFLLTHGENIVDLMGGEIDRIEMKLMKKFPELRHCDLEIL